MATVNVPPNLGQSAYAAGSAGNPTTTSASLVDLTDMSVTITTRGGPILAWLVLSASHSTLGASITIAINLDGASDSGSVAESEFVANNAMLLSTFVRFTAAAGQHTIKGRWATSASTATGTGTQRFLLVQEVPA